jgi:S1-C subfamily serine protease
MNTFSKAMLTLVGTLTVVVGGMYYLHPKVKALAELQASTVSLTMDNGATCSGWVLKGSHKVITAAHCVAEDAPDAKVQVDFHDGTGKHLFVPSKVGDVTGTKPDLAVLVPLPSEKVKWPEGLSVCPFTPYYREPLLMFGDPLGFPQAISGGFVSNPAQKVIGAREAPYIQYDGALSPGNSGGAAVDVEYQCVIASADALIQSFAGSAVNFLEPASRLSELK